MQIYAHIHMHMNMNMHTQSRLLLNKHKAQVFSLMVLTNMYAPCIFEAIYEKKKMLNLN